MRLTDHFPLFHVNLALFITLLPFSFIFSFHSLTAEVKLRWQSNITGFTFREVDYRSEMFKNGQNIVGFVIWTIQVIATIGVVIYHIITPHHPKYYSTKKNIVSIIAHMIGGTVAIFGLYIGALTNRKEVCLMGVLFGVIFHWPSVVWQSRQTHGQQETSVPSYMFLTWLLMQGYAEFFLYDASYQCVFTCAMTLNVFAMVRVLGVAAEKSNMEVNVDKSLVFAGFSNAAFIGGSFLPLLFLFALFSWNMFFEMIKPFPRFMLRIERGYNDSVPDLLEEKRGIKFNEELARQQEKYKDRKEAIARALWRVLAGYNDDVMDLEEVVELYQSWGMPDALSAAEATFKKADVDHDGSIQYEEFKVGFKHIIEGIYIKGEFESLRKQPTNVANFRIGGAAVQPLFTGSSDGSSTITCRLTSPTPMPT